MRRWRERDQVAVGAAAALTTISTSGDTVTVTGAVDLGARDLTVEQPGCDGLGDWGEHQVEPDDRRWGAGAEWWHDGDVTVTGATGDGTALNALTMTGNDVSLGDVGGGRLG